MRPSWLPEKRYCWCGCKQELTGTSRQKFAEKSHYWPWFSKLCNRGVHPVKDRRYCKICGAFFLVFKKASNKRLCANSACTKESKRLAQIKGGEARAALIKAKDSMTKETPYLYGAKPIALEMRQRAIKMCKLECVQL